MDHTVDKTSKRLNWQRSPPHPGQLQVNNCDGKTQGAEITLGSSVTLSAPQSEAHFAARSITAEFASLSVSRSPLLLSNNGAPMAVEEIKQHTIKWCVCWWASNLRLICNQQYQYVSRNPISPPQQLIKFNVPAFPPQASSSQNFGCLKNHGGHQDVCQTIQVGARRKRSWAKPHVSAQWG